MLNLTPEQIDAIMKGGDDRLKKLVHAYYTHPYYSFTPRPDNVAEYDEQSAFVQRRYHFDTVTEQYIYEEPPVKFSVCLGGTGCIHGTQLVYVHGTGMVPVEEIDRPFITRSWDGQRECLALANRPFVKGTADVYRYTLQDRRQFLATAEHRVLLASGCWVSAKRAFEEGLSLQIVGGESAHQRSASDLPLVLPNIQVLSQFEPRSFVRSSATALASRRRAKPRGEFDTDRPFCDFLPPSVACQQRSSGGIAQKLFRGDVRHYLRTLQDSLGDCRHSPRFCGERLRTCRVCDQASSPPLDGALVHNHHYLRQGGLGCESECSRACPQCDHPSTPDSSHPDWNARGASGNDVFCIPSRPTLPSGQDERRFGSLKGRPVRTTSSSHQPASQSHSRSPYRSSVKDSVIVSMEHIGVHAYYDFTVHGTHNYVIDGISHHNSGKTAAAAIKVARHVLEIPPPRELCPFWIIGDSYDTTCDVCWNEKLSQLIPEEHVLGFDWYRRSRRWPFAVFLRHPTRPGRTGWVLEFKSYKQGIAMMKAKSIGGYWFNEEVPYPLVNEVQGRCRDYNSPGWADFTPIEVVSPEWLDLYADPPKGWRFFHLNTEKNTALADGWAKDYLDQIPDDMRETRRIGKFTSLSGQVFKEWNSAVHVIAPFRPGSNMYHIRGIDFGFNNPFACLWGARDRDGRYYIYDEHYESGKLNKYHAAKIKQRKWDDTQPWYGPTYTDHDAQQRAELEAEGIRCTPARKNILPGIECLRSLMMVRGDGKPRLFVTSNCTNLIREIRGLRYPKGTDSRNPRDEPMDVANHTTDSLRYLCYSDSMTRGMNNLPAHLSVRPMLSGRHGVLLSRR